MKSFMVFAILNLLSFSFVVQENETKGKFIEMYQKKISLPNNHNSYKKCREFKKVGINSEILILNYILLDGKHTPIGTMVDCGYLDENGNCTGPLSIGSYQTHTDTFQLENYDSLIVFKNPFYPRVIHNEIALESNGDSSGIMKPGIFYASFIAGFSHSWTISGKLLYETKSLTNKKKIVLIYDTINKKVNRKINILNEPKNINCTKHQIFPY